MVILWRQWPGVAPSRPGPPCGRMAMLGGVVKDDCVDGAVAGDDDQAEAERTIKPFNQKSS